MVAQTLDEAPVVGGGSRAGVGAAGLFCADALAAAIALSRMPSCNGVRSNELNAILTPYSLKIAYCEINAY